MAASDQIVVAGEFELLIAPDATALPTDTSTALDPAFISVGLTTRDGSAFDTAPEFKNVESHQSQYATRTFRTKQTGTVKAALQEWNDKNFTTAFGGGTITGTLGEFKYEPPVGSGTDVVVAILKVTDGTKVYLFVVPQCQAQSPVSLPFSPDSESVLPLELMVLGDGTNAPWFMLTNDPAFDPAA